MFASRRIAVLGGDAFKQEHSLAFDGTDEWVSLGTSVNAGTTATFSVWIKRDDPTNGVETVLGEGDNSSDYLLYLNKNTHLFVRIGDPYYQYDDAAIQSAINTTDWIQIVVVRETTTGKVYINGDLKETLTTGSPTTWSVNTTFDTIGSAEDAATPFDGNIDEVAIWNKALSAGDISALYQAKGASNLIEDGNSANLKGWWRMGDGTEEGGGTTIYDMSSNSNNGTMISMDASNFKRDTP